ncbi:MAG TPA: bifunctional 4-hydroxy-2-oxoglutarate aldolase/2-dehydro-3-deoxy-phosphogluconate aldolase, partial [Chryseosolibacter sp.]
MAFSKQEIVDGMREKGIVPLFTHDNEKEAFEVVEAAYKGGIRAFEFTNRRPNSFEIFSHLIRERKKFPDLMLGIGTVMDAATTKKFIDAGA